MPLWGGYRPCCSGACPIQIVSPTGFRPSGPANGGLDAIVVALPTGMHAEACTHLHRTLGNIKLYGMGANENGWMSNLS